MRKRILYYTFFKGNVPWHSYVVATYTDFSTRVWHKGDRGYIAAKNKALYP